MRTTTTSLLLLALPIMANAFSSIPYPNNNNNVGNKLPTTQVVPSSSQQQQQQQQTTTTVSTPWRVVLDIGREPLANMPFNWARSGCRMPLAIPCDFTLSTRSDDDETTNNKEYLVLPQSDTVSFTGPDGAVIKPIVGGTWELSNDKKFISLTLTFPETLQRRDVIIDGGATVELSARVYTQQELDQLNDAYYKARENTWQVGSELNDIVKRQGAAKKWNEEKRQWEKPKPNVNVLYAVQKRMNYWMSKIEQDKRNQDRPDPNTISDRGELPGLDGGIYIAKSGSVRASKNGPVMGTWQAQPITKLPVSYHK
jgi:hypothetical protein